MKNVLVSTLLLVCAAAPVAAQVELTSDPAGVAMEIFYTSANTDVTPPDFAPGSDRLNALGITTAVSVRRFIADFRYEHDFASFPDLLARAFDLDGSELSRDRYEMAAGYALNPFIDVHTGLRNERITFDPSMRGNVEFLALVAGVGFHSPQERPVAIEGWMRGYYGGTGLRSDRVTDTRGYGVEVRLPIRLFSSHFRIVPGVAYDQIQTDLDRLDLSALRFTIGFGFAARSEQMPAPTR